jgi:hypothetical protein
VLECAHGGGSLSSHARKCDGAFRHVLAGIGSKFDKSKASAFPAGSFVAIPEGLKHFAFTKSGAVVLQIDGMGPEKDIMVKGGKM